VAEFSDSVVAWALRFNPCVTAHELRMRMRGGRPFGLLFFYSFVAAVTVLIALAITLEERRAYGPGPSSSPFGRIALGVLAYAQLSLICLIVPAYSAGAITMEREKRTLEMLRATLLSPSDIVSGKLLVVLAFTVVLLASSVPVAAWCILLGGVAPQEVFQVYSYLFATAALLGSLGVFLSTLLRRSIGAIVSAYGILLIFCIAAPLLGSYILFAPMGMLASSPTGGPSLPTFGADWAIGFFIAGCFICGWLLFLGLRWLWRRFTGRGRGWVGTLLAMVATGWVLSWMGVWLGNRVVAVVQGASPAWLGVLNPYFGLSGVLDGVYAQMLGAASSTRFMTMGVPSVGTSGLQTTIWALPTAICLVVAMALWALSVRIFAARR